MLRLNGITPVMATPFLQDESINEPELRVEIDAAIEGGAAAVCGPGYGAEYYKMSDEERRRFIEILVDQSRGRVPVIAATTSGSVYNTIELSRYAESAGADCLMINTPRTAPLPAAGIVDYYSRICDTVQIPLMVQDADFTGAGLPSGIFVDLAKTHRNFAFAKLEVMMPGPKCAQIIQETGGQVQIIYGLGGIAMLDGLANGASAMMPGSACIETYVRIYDLYREGKRDQARSLFHRLLPYLSFALQHLELAIQTEKHVLLRRGIFSNARMRRPTLDISPHYQSQLEELVEEAVALVEECKPKAAAAN
jgi:dihydrodipicolinate synthase/N-acetylneuraminate lyase